MWRNYEEVFDLAVVRGVPVAATNGGLMEYRDRVWRPIESPAGLRSIEAVDPFVVRTAAGNLLTAGAQGWTPLASWAGEARPHDVVLLAGAFLSDSVHPYSALSEGGVDLLGTNGGLFRVKQGKWERESLPTAMPVTRPNGIAKVGQDYVIGGIGGLYLGRPGAWRQIAQDSVRQILEDGSDVWVVHGSGELDRLDPQDDLIYPDVLTGNSRRPWTSCVGRCGSLLLFGSGGGWMEHADPARECFPTELQGDVVLAIAGRDKIRWIGTQKSGVLRYGAGPVKRWNPGNGLDDTWVTSLCQTRDGLIVGTMHSGIFRIVGDWISRLSSPTHRVTCVTKWQGALVVGGMDGAWMQRDGGWTPLPTHGEETTSISAIERRLCVTTNCGVYFL